MSPFVTACLLFLIVLMSSLQFSQGKVNDDRFHIDRSESSSSNDERVRERNLKKLRYYLLTSDAAERAARREKTSSLRRELVRQNPR